MRLKGEDDMTIRYGGPKIRRCKRGSRARTHCWGRRRQLVRILVDDITCLAEGLDALSTRRTCARNDDERQSRTDTRYLRSRRVHQIVARCVAGSLKANHADANRCMPHGTCFISGHRGNAWNM